MLELGLSAGSKLLGGLMSDNRADRQWKQSLDFEKKKFAAAKDQFDQQMDASVQRRVKDAQAAGIHPLFAMGASVGSSPTLTAGSSPAPTGSALGNAVQSLGADLARAEIRTHETQSEKNEAEAALADSKTATIAQGLASTGRDALNGGPIAKEPLYEVPIVPTRNAQGFQTGVPPIERQGRTADGRRITLFSDSIPGLEEANVVLGPAQYAKHWLADKFMWLDQLTPQFIKDNPLYLAPNPSKQPKGTKKNTRVPRLRHRGVSREYLRRYLDHAK